MTITIVLNLNLKRRGKKNETTYNIIYILLIKTTIFFLPLLLLLIKNMFNKSSIIKLAISMSRAHSRGKHLLDLLLVEPVPHHSEDVPEVRRAHIPAAVLVEHGERLNDLVGVLGVGVLDAHRLDELVLGDGPAAPVLVDDFLSLLWCGVLAEPVHQVKKFFEANCWLAFADIRESFLQFSKRVFVDLYKIKIKINVCVFSSIK